MKKLLAFFLLLSPVAGSAAELHLSDLSAGMYSYQSPNKIPDNAAAYIQNFFTDIQPMAVERSGTVLQDSNLGSTSKSVPGTWRFQDNTGSEWIIEYSSRTFYKHIAGGTPVAFGQITTTANVPRAATNLGKIMFVNGVDAAWTFDGTSTATVAGAPIGTLIVAWRTRFVIANITGSQSTVRFSEDGSATNWTLGGNPTDPFSIQIGGANDGYNVKCMGNYLDYLIIQRKYDTWAVAGFDQSDVSNRNVSSEIGCIDAGTNREFDGTYLFLSWRGMEEMSGFTIKPISDPVRNYIDLIVKNSANSRSAITTLASDWNSGSQNPLNFADTTTVSGDLIARTTTYMFTSTGALSMGSVTSGFSTFADTNTSGALQTTFPDEFTSLRTGTGGTKAVWTTTTASGESISLSGDTALFADNGTHGGSAILQSANPLATPSGTTFYYRVSSVTPGATGCGFNFGFKILNSTVTCTYYHTAVAGTGQINSISNLTGNDATCPNLATTIVNIGTPFDVFLWMNSSKFSLVIVGTTTSGSKLGSHTVSLSALSFASILNPQFLGGCTATAESYSYALDRFGVAPQTFTYTTSGFNTGISSPTWDVISSTISGSGSGSGSITLTSQSGSDGISFDSAVSATVGSALISAPKQFLQLNAAFNQTLSSGSVLTYNNFLGGASSSGTWTSSLISIGSLINSWGPVLISDTKTGGTIIYQFGSTNTASVAAITNWTTITNGAAPTVSTNSFAAWRGTLIPTSRTSDVRVADFTTTWNEGTTLNLASTVYDRRYWLALTTNAASGSVLDMVLVYQRNRTWTLLKGLTPASFTLWRDGLYFGDSNPTGNVYQFDVGSNDNGSVISSYIVSKSYDMGSAYKDKDYRRSYLTYFGGVSGTFSLGYYNEQQSTLNNLGTANMSDGTGQVRQKYTFPLDGTVPLQGRELQYVLTKSGTGDRLKLFDISLDYSLKEAP